MMDNIFPLQPFPPESVIVIVKIYGLILGHPPIGQKVVKMVLAVKTDPLVFV